jgi:CubicO group peptidase (beta-lactamase class C family)
VADPFDAVAREFERLVGAATGGGALVVRRGDRTLLDLCTGTADRFGRVPWTRDTLGLSFSTTKGVASTVIHRLADRGLLDYDEPVATYWPAFAAGGKGRISVRHVLTHRAGLQSIRAVASRAEDLLDHLRMEARLAAAPSHGPTERSAYHAITYGWLLSGLARHITGRGMTELFREEIAAPLGLRGLHIGVAPGDGVMVAEPVGSALRQMTVAAQLLAPVWRRTALTRTAVDALHVPGFHRLFEGLEAPIWASQMPAVSGAFTADALARMYAALAASGGPLLSPRTAHEAGRVQLRGADAVLGLRMRWRLGYHQAFGSGPVAPRAFGHYGYGGSGGWADPQTGLSLGFVTNRIGSVSTPLGDLNLFRLTGLVRRAAEQSGLASPAAGRAA